MVKILMNKFPDYKYKKSDDFFKDYYIEHSKIFKSISKTNLNFAIKIINKKYLNGKKVFVCGNGGSAALANHFACDHQKILSTIKKIRPKLFSLCSNIPLITAISNDKKYEDIFADQIISHGKKGDLLYVFHHQENQKT